MGSYNEPNPDNYWEVAAQPEEAPQGGPAPEQSPAGIVRTPAPDGSPADLNALYQQYFGRNVDPSGAATFAGQDANAVIQGILGSQEYANMAAATAGVGNIPQAGIASLGGLEFAPPWLEPNQYSLYGFDQNGKRDKSSPYRLPNDQFAPNNFNPDNPDQPKWSDLVAKAKENNPALKNATYDPQTNLYITKEGWRIGIDPDGQVTGAAAPLSSYEINKNTVAPGYRNIPYVGSTYKGDTVNINGQTLRVGSPDYVANLKTGQLYTDKSGQPVGIATVSPQDSNMGLGPQLLNTAALMAMSSLNPIMGIGVGAMNTAYQGGTLEEIAKNVGIATLMSYLTGGFDTPLGFDPSSTSSAFPGGVPQFDPSGNIPDFNIPDLNTPDFNIPDFNVPDLNIPDVNLPDVNVPDVNIPDVSVPNVPIEPDITQILQQTYPNANIGTPVPNTPLTPDVIQAANLPIEPFPSGTLVASTTPYGINFNSSPGTLLPPDTPTSVLLKTAEENAKRGVSAWWQVTSNDVVNAGIKNAIYGAGMGALTSGVTGGSTAKGAMYGAAAGAVTGAGGQYLGQTYFPEGFNPTSSNVANVGIKSALGGAANSAIATALAGGDVGKAAIIGGIISGTLGTAFQAADNSVARSYEFPEGGDASRMPTAKETATSAGRVLNNMNNLQYGNPVGVPNPYGGVGLNPKIYTGAQPYSGTGLNPEIQNPYGGVGLNPNLQYITSGLANNAEALAYASGVPISRQEFDARGGLSTEDAMALDTAITNAEQIGIPYANEIRTLIPFTPFIQNPPGNPQSPSSPSGPNGPSSPKKPVTKKPKGMSARDWSNYLLKNKVNASNVYTQEATGYQRVLKEGGEVEHFDIGGSVSNSFSNLFKPVEQAVIQPIGQAAPFLKDVLPYAAMAAAPFLGPTAAAGLGALGSGFGTTPGAGFNLKRALMGGIASYGLSNIGAGLTAAATASDPSLLATVSPMGSIEEALPNGAMNLTEPNPATTQGFWDKITNKASYMGQGAQNIIGGGPVGADALNTFKQFAGLPSGVMAIMGGTGVLGVDEADAQNQAAQGINSAAAQQQAILANRRAQAKTNAQNAVAANPFRFDVGGSVDDEPGMDSARGLYQGNLQNGFMGMPSYAAGGMPPRFLSGGGDGMSDSIKANIEGNQEARLADGEFVIPADVVSHLGNGSSKAGAKQLYSMMDRIRQARTGRKSQGREVNPNKFMPV